MASEDARFYEHNGVDTKGIARAFVANHQAGEVSQGASTLTMQYVRNVLRDGAQTAERGRAATEQTAARKLREMRLAIAAREAADQDRDPGALPQRRLLRPPRLRHLRRRAGLLLQAPHGPDPGRGGDPGRPGARRPSAYDPAGSDQPRRHRPAQLRHRPDGASWATSAPTSARRGQEAADRAAAHRPAQRLRLGAADAQRLGLLLRLLQELVDARSRRSATTRCERRGQAAPRRVPDRHLARPEDPGRSRMDARASTRSRSAARTPTAWSRSSPGTGRVKAMAVNRIYSLDQTNNGPHTDPSRRGKVQATTRTR